MLCYIVSTDPVSYLISAYCANSRPISYVEFNQIIEVCKPILKAL